MRFLAVVLLIQGLAPALLFGAWRPGGGILLLIAVIYSFLALGLWRAKRWAWPAAFLLTALQAVGGCSPSFSWRFFVALFWGLGFGPAPTFSQVPVYGLRSFGARVDIAVTQPSPTLLAEFSSLHAERFLLVNVFALGLTALLLLVRLMRWVESPSAPTSKPADGANTLPSTPSQPI